jgi:hypothetical protein
MSQSSNEARILLAFRLFKITQNYLFAALQAFTKSPSVPLQHRQDGIQSRRDYIPKSRKLSDLEEQIIVRFILDLDSRGFPSRLRFVEELANSLLTDRDMLPVGKRWSHNFVKRQPELKTRLFRTYDYQRAKCEDPTIIRGCFRCCYDAQSCRVHFCGRIQLLIIVLLFKNHQGLLYLSYP